MNDSIDDDGAAEDRSSRLKNFQLAIAILLFAAGVVAASAQTSKPEHCEEYARNAVASTPTSTGPVRGAARGAVVGGIFGNAGAGAASGALVGTARRAGQRSRSYQYYYDSCMAR
jgi:hypothetical protein